MKILLIGRNGQLGSDILRNSTGHEIVAPDRRSLDVTRQESVGAAMADHRPDAVVNTAAFHDVPLCEVEYGQAFRVNCAAVRDLAVACRKAGALFVTFSTDYVFGGEKRTPYSEDDRPTPLQMYGITKLAGEFAALSAAPEHSVVIRTCGLYGITGAASKGGNFVDKRIRDAQKQEVLEVSCDQVVCPTYTDDLSRAVLQLISHAGLVPGIYHLVNEGECSWHEFTKKALLIAGFETEVKPVDRKGSDGMIRRPLYSVLGNKKAKAMGIVLPHWKDSLSRYIQKKFTGDISPAPPKQQR